jgi:hypothetical protein
MTTMATDYPRTTSGLLFGESGDRVEALARTLQQKGVMGSLGAALQRLSQAGRQAADREVAGVVNSVVDFDLGDLVVAGWRKGSDLADAARRTAANPGSSAVVELATQRITSVHRPSLNVLINNVQVTTLNFELEVEFVIKALIAIVREGHVANLHSGACDVTVTLTAQGVQLAKQNRHFEMPMLVRWPLSLHPGDTDPPAGSVVSPSAPSPPPRRTPVIHHSVRQRRDRHLTRASRPAD